MGPLKGMRMIEREAEQIDGRNFGYHSNSKKQEEAKEIEQDSSDKQREQLGKGVWEAKLDQCFKK